MKERLLEVLGIIADAIITGLVLGLILAIAGIVAGYVFLGFARIVS